jgi:3-hydroxyisobutyrate dehydrogenase
MRPRSDRALRVAWLGTGVMGAPMACNLARAGLTVAAWNRTPAKAHALAGEGPRPCASPAAAATRARILVTMLADGAVTEACVHAPDGALAALEPGAVWIQMATVGVPAAERLRDLAHEHGVTYVDAPVLGSREPAEKGDLVILASGPEEARQSCSAVFDALGRTLWIGSAGAGSRLKVVINGWLMSTTAALAETLALAESLGVDPAGFFDATGNGAIGALYTELNGPAMVARDFPRNFPLALAAKDARLALEAADDRAGALRVLAATHEQYVRAVEQGHGDEDWAAVIYAATQ